MELSNPDEGVEVLQRLGKELVRAGASWSGRYRTTTLEGRSALWCTTCNELDPPDPEAFLEGDLDDVRKAWKEDKEFFGQERRGWEVKRAKLVSRIAEIEQQLRDLMDVAAGLRRDLSALKLTQDS